MAKNSKDYFRAPASAPNWFEFRHFMLAEQYLKAGVILSDSAAQDLATLRTRLNEQTRKAAAGEPVPLRVEPIVLGPLVVVLAHAIELYFKSVIQTAFLKSMGHDLPYLFELVPIDLRARTVSASGMPLSEFCAALASTRGAFEGWRYPLVEGSKQINHGLLTQIARAANEVIWVFGFLHR